jgi:hypothetical protein
MRHPRIARRQPAERVGDRGPRQQRPLARGSASFAGPGARCLDEGPRRVDGAARARVPPDDKDRTPPDEQPAPTFPPLPCRSRSRRRAIRLCTRTKRVRRARARRRRRSPRVRSVRGLRGAAALARGHDAHRGERGLVHAVAPPPAGVRGARSPRSDRMPSSRSRTRSRSRFCAGRARARSRARTRRATSSSRVWHAHRFCSRSRLDRARVADCGPASARRSRTRGTILAPGGAWGRGPRASAHAYLRAPYRVPSRFRRAQHHVTR